VDRQAGQATVELIAAIPLLLIAGAVALQLLVTGYVLTLADGAAEAGALALAAGQPGISAARESLPEWAQDGAEITVQGGEVRVRLRPPSPIEAVAKHLAITSTAYARPPGK
jgi:hypothetical protein